MSQRLREIICLLSSRYRVLLCFLAAAYLMTGLMVFRDYGISWDEPISRRNGVIAYNYAVHGDPTILSDRDKHYGTAFEMILTVAERVSGVRDSRRIYMMRHLLTFLFFYISVLVFYRLSQKILGSWHKGLLSAVFLVISPRVFAHSFYNSKDAAMMAAFIISVWTMVRFLDRRTLSSAVLHAAASALAIDIRIVGMLVPLMTFLFVSTDAVFLRPGRKELKRTGLSMALYCVVLPVLVVMFWPTLWTEPLVNLAKAIGMMSRFVRWDLTVLYMGGYIRSTELPWHYIPVWILLTTPLLYTLCFVSGVVSLALSMKEGARGFYIGNRYLLICAVWLFVPVGSVIILRSVLYDAWRQMMFVYPPFIILAAMGFFRLRDIFPAGRARAAAMAALFTALTGSLLSTGYFMVRRHPYQNVYFNVLAGRSMGEVKGRFEMDYWGLSYRKGLEYVLSADSSDSIKLAVANDPGLYNSLILPERERKRIVFVKDPRDADYFLGEYRWHNGEYPFGEEVFSVEVGDAKILTVRKMRHDINNALD